MIAGKKILIRGGNFRNKGAEAMLLTACSEISKRIDGARIYASLKENEFEESLLCGIEPCIINYKKYSKLRKAAAMLRPDHMATLLCSGRNFTWEAVHVYHMDAVIDVSGYAYSDVFGVTKSRNAAVLANFCKRKGKAFIAMPQAWGPFNKPEISGYVKQLCNDASLVYARDEMSLAELRQLCPGKLNIELAPDIALCFDARGQIHKDDFIFTSQNAKNGRLIAISPNWQIYLRTGKGDKNNSYIKLLADLAQYCIEKHAAEIVLVPHDFNLPGVPDPDDRYLCALIHSMLPEDKRVTLLDQFYTSSMLKSLAASCDMVIGSRFHCLIFALSSCVPVVALGWSHKYNELLRSFEMQDCVCDLGNFDFSRLCDKVDDVINNRDSLKSKIQTNLIALQSQVNTVFDKVAGIIKNT